MNKSDNIKNQSSRKSTRDNMPNAWLVKLGGEATLKDFSITISIDPNLLKGVEEEDAFVLIDEQSVIAVARVYRKRCTLEDITFYFDGIIRLEPIKTLKELDIPTPATDSAITRLDWPAFDNVLKNTRISDYKDFPVLAGSGSKEQEYIRELLQYAVVDDLLGPANGPFEEIVGMSVRDRYLVGKLAPMSPSEEQCIEGLQGSTASEEGTAEELKPHEGHHQPGEEFPSTEGSLDPDDDTSQELDASKNQSLVPSSMGFTFCVDGSIKNVELQANWGRYERGESEKADDKTGKTRRAWKRIPSGGKATVSLHQRTISPISIDQNCPEVVIQGTVSAPLESGDRMITLFLVNTQTKPEQNQDSAWIFQPEMIVRDSECNSIFRRRPLLNSNDHDDERISLEMIYRKQVEFAVGHGVSVHATTAKDDPEHAVEIRTVVLPQYEIPITETPGMSQGDRPVLRKLIEEGYLDMQRLAELDRAELIEGLRILTDDYSAWIKEQQQNIGTVVKGYDNAAEAAIIRCKEILERLKQGIEVLGSDDKALEAFRFANKAMASQRIHSIYSLLKRRGEDVEIKTLDIPKNRSWRPFQLAFILLSIPSLANPVHKDRTRPLEAYADLLWFPTGGGKTEAYLGVAAFTMSIRRLQGKLGGLDGSRGLAVIMRYTLRLLSLSQRSVKNVDELTSRVSSKDIPKKLDQLEVKYKTNWEQGETRSIDIVLATNMLSVGVDVNRLGLMVVNGQPKNTAEYIQATSRVGRFFPGLVCTVLTWARPRDLSHYETFEHYHSTFYKHVEAQSVTPFAPRALDRGLTGSMVSLLRLENDELNPNDGAEKLNDTIKPEIMPVKQAISDRAWNVKDKIAKQNSEAMIADRIDRWAKEANKGGRRLGYETKRRQGDMVALLKKPGLSVWDEFTVPLSMREVEPEFS